MVTHGKGPKFIYVRKHGRWVRGERRDVESHFRYLPPLTLLPSNLQLELDFGF
jgi:hypothetical protein